MLLSSTIFSTSVMIRVHIRSWATGRNTLYSFQSYSFITDSCLPVEALRIASPTTAAAKTFDCASLKPCASNLIIRRIHRNKISLQMP
ncbi:hypothetical protein D3C76_1431210 [compost metagenome]